MKKIAIVDSSKHANRNPEIFKKEYDILIDSGKIVKMGKNIEDMCETIDASGKYILPGFGKLVSKSKDAYTYLPESVNAFPEDKAFILELEKAGYTNNSQKRLSMGIATLYKANKK